MQQRDAVLATSAHTDFNLPSRCTGPPTDTAASKSSNETLRDLLLNAGLHTFSSYEEPLALL